MKENVSAWLMKENVETDTKALYKGCECLQTHNREYQNSDDIKKGCQSLIAEHEAKIKECKSLITEQDATYNTTRDLMFYSYMDHMTMMEVELEKIEAFHKKRLRILDEFVFQLRQLRQLRQRI